VSDDAPAVVVRGDDGGDVAAAVREAGGRILARSPTDAADREGIEPPDAEAPVAPDVVLAVGEAALSTVADDVPDAPVLPVAAGVGRYGVSRSAVARAVAAVRGGDVWTVTHPLLSVAVGGQSAGRAVTAATLVTSEAARISEYTVTDGVERLASFRADGVVVATPLGSPGYARAVGGSVLAPETGVSVVPISPYATQSDSWVVRPPVELTVQREDAPVSLVLDDEVARRVPASAPVVVDVDGTATFLRVPSPDAE
jgi:NAD+ kinase